MQKGRQAHRQTGTQADRQAGMVKHDEAGDGDDITTNEMKILVPCMPDRRNGIR